MSSSVGLSNAALNHVLVHCKSNTNGRDNRAFLAMRIEYYGLCGTTVQNAATTASINSCARDPCHSLSWLFCYNAAFSLQQSRTGLRNNSTLMLIFSAKRSPCCRQLQPNRAHNRPRVQSPQYFAALQPWSNRRRPPSLESSAAKT